MRPGSALSLAYVRKRANEHMLSTCKIERVNPPSWDSVTNVATAGTRSLIYTGPCRLWEVSGGGIVMVGEQDLPIQQTQLSIPWDADPVPKRDDEVEILTSDIDASLVGNRFRILDVAKAGELRPTRRFSVQHIEHSRWV